jgi:uncharacterized membrane protein YgcG
MISIPISFLPGVARVGLRVYCKKLHLLACIVLAACAGTALAACPAQPPRLHVVDPAGLLGAKADAIAARLRAYQQASGHQLFVLAAPSLDGASIEECAVTVFEHWKLGRKGIDDGVLLLVAAKERKIRIEVGYGLEGTLTDVQSSRIIRDVMREPFARGEYGEGVEQGLGAIIGVLDAGDPVSPPKQPTPRAAHAAIDWVGVIVLTAAMVITLPLTQALGMLGLAIFMILDAIFAHELFPDARGFLLAAALCAAWCFQRWRLIRTNVREYQLNGSRNTLYTWIWCFCAFGFGAPQPEPSRSRKRSVDSSYDEGAVSFSFSGGGGGDSASDSGDSSSSSSSDDSGGGSGGGGASDDY